MINYPEVSGNSSFSARQLKRPGTVFSLSGLKLLSLLLLVLFAGRTFHATAADEVYTSRQALSTTTPLTVYDARYAEMASTPLAWPSVFTNVSVANTVTVGIDPTIPISASFEATVNLLISYKVWNATLNQFDLLSMTKALTVNYDVNGGLNITDRAAQSFTGAHSMNITISSITCVSGTCVPANLYLEAEINVKRFYNFTSLNPTGVSHTPSTAGAILSASYLDLNWDYMQGAESYELEYVHINDYTASKGAFIAQGDLTYDYYLNSTRVELTSTHYTIPKIYDHGYVLYRVRGVGRGGVGFTRRWEGNWSAPESGTVGSHPVANIIPILNDYDQYMNWSHQVGFTEGGKRMEAVSFMDGMGRTRQTVASNPVTEQVVVSNVYFDDMGRAAVSDLPTPVAGPMRHMPNFNLANVTGTPSYNKDYFDQPGGFCAANPIGFSTSSGSGRYYSQLNPDREGENAAIPDAEHFPFSIVKYKDDLLNRVASAGAPGPQLTLNSGHEKRFIELSTDQVELNRMFGTEAGLAKNYQKLVTVDENGQAYVQYMDMSGRTVASYMMGSSPAQLDALETNLVTTQETVLIANGSGDAQDLTVPSSTLTKTQLIMQTGDYVFDYSFTPEEFTAGCGESSICLDCLYDFDVKVTDDCGTVYFTHSETINGESMDAACAGEEFQLLTTLELYGEIGTRRGVEYTITKTLTVNHDAIDTYWCHYMEVSCASGVPELFNTLYEAAEFQECTNVSEGLEGDESPCDFYKAMMLEDLSPGGQYADYSFDGTTYTFPDPLSILNPSNTLGGDWDAVTYLDALGAPIYTTNSAGATVTPDNLTINEFIEHFDPSWALSLLTYHPEICFLESCVANSSSEEFDRDLRNTHSFNEAFLAGYFGPLNSAPGNPGLFGTNTSVDPFFAAHPTEKTLMTDLMNTYGTLGGISWSMWNYAVILANPSWEEVDFNLNVKDYQKDDCGIDYVWQKFRELYLREKATLVITLQQAECGADNAMIGVPGAYEDKIRRWPNLAELEGQNPIDPNPDVNYAADIAAYCEETCEEYADEWLEQLSGCGISPVILPDLRDDLIALCMSGCSTSNPYPGSTSPAGQTIQDILGSYGIAETDVCTGLLISEPAPYTDPAEHASLLVRPLDTCACDLILQAEVDLAQHLVDFPVAPLYTTVEQMLEHTTGLLIEELDPLLCACDKAARHEWVPGDFAWNPASNDNLAATGYTIPTGLSCAPTDCADCELIALYMDTLAERFLGEERLQASTYYATIVTNYLNQELGYDYGSALYMEFLNRCNATSEAPYCVANPVADEWLAIMKLIAYRGQLTGPSVPLENENIAFKYSRFADLVPGGHAASYQMTTAGAIHVLHFGMEEEDCQVRLDNTQGIDLSSIVSFDAISTGEATCGGTGSFKVKISYLACGLLKTAWLPATSDCFDARTCYCGETPLTLCDLLTEPVENACYQPLLNELYDEAMDQYDALTAEIYDAFTAEYLSKCAEAFGTENFSYSGFSNNYQYTLFYYDQAGNLVRSVAPEGVDLLPASSSDAIDFARLHARDLVPAAPILPAHDFETRYNYNSYDELVQTTNPDQEGSTSFWYDRYGRIVASQNPVQLAELKYSYILRDAQGRPVEAGQICRNVPMRRINPGEPASLPTHVLGALTETIAKANDLGISFKIWVYSGVRTEVTMTTYDDPLSPAIAAKFAAGTQQNLRLRIASVAYFEAVPANPNPAASYYTTGYTSALHYSYDIHGNVMEHLQDLPELLAVDQNIKSTQYSFELISGNVQKAEYQAGKKDYLKHEYVYDQINRLTEVFTATDKVHSSRDAHYLYYDYGPLARVETGAYKVQGQDYAYTIQGWLKGVNSGSLNTAHDLGRDGKTGYSTANSAAHRDVARDVTGYTLGYFEGDYRPVGYSTMEAATAGTSFGSAGGNLYNGNIRHTVTAIQGMKVLGAAYRYDQLNRLTGMNTYYNTKLDSLKSNNWTNGALTSDYQNSYTYDRNGNIKTLNRNGIGSQLDMDRFVYDYPPNITEPWNRLNKVTDNGTNYVAYDDIKTGQGTNNYQYDALGQLTKDVTGGITAIDWRRGDKKARSITTGTDVITFLYNPFGVRIAKIKKPGGTTDNTLWIYTYYAHDANGQVMAVYDVDYSLTNTVVYLEEQHLYGASRLGMIEDHKPVFTQALVVGDPPGLYKHTLGKKRYELANHLGNVNAVISDRKVVDPDYVAGVNYDFNGGTTSGWYVGGYSCAALAPVVSGNQLVVANNCATDVSRYEATTPGKTYTFSVEINRTGVSNLDVILQSTTTAGTPGTAITTFVNPVNGQLTYTFVATQNFVRIFFRKISTEVASYTLDNLRLERVNTQYLAVVKMKADYYPFGMEMPGRSTNSSDYRFGYNGMEKDDEVKGNANSYTTEFRQYDPRLGRWMSLDPLMDNYAEMSPYVAFNNNPIYFTDPDGLEGSPFDAWSAGWNDAFNSNVFELGFGRENAAAVYPGDLVAQEYFLKGQIAADIATLIAGGIEIDFGAGALGAAGTLAINIEGAIVTEPAALATLIVAAVATAHGTVIMYSAAKGLKKSYAQLNSLNKKVTAQKNRAKANANGEGIIYRRTNPKTGKEYYGQAKNQKAYEQRKKYHDKKHGVTHEFQIVERGKVGKDLNIKEENWIRKNGGPNNGKGNQGTLENKRHEMNDKRYDKGGGKIAKPLTSGRKKEIPKF